MATISPEKRPKNYVMILFPAFQLLDVAGPLDILRNITSDAAAKDITLTIVADTMDPVSTAPVPPPGANWKFPTNPVYPKAADGRSVITTFDPTMAPTTTFDACIASLQKTGQIPDGAGGTRDIDVLIVPGGLGSRLARIPKEADMDDLSSSTENVGPAKKFIDAAVPYIKQALMTVCTGSDILAKCGGGTLLDGRLATSNMFRFDSTAERNPGVHWRRARWVRSYAASDPRAAEQAAEYKLDTARQHPSAKHLELWTSAGISAGIDLTLALVAEVYGDDFARSMARRLEYEWREIAMGEIDPLYEKMEEARKKAMGS